MFPIRYFSNEAFAPRYFAKVGAAAAPSTSGNIGYAGWQISVIHRNWMDMILVILR